MSIGSVLNFEDVIDIAQFLVERGLNNNGITISVELESKELLDKINEDFFYRITNGENYKALDPDITEVNLNIEGIDFKYYIKEKNNGND